jgi:asparagine synthase (glutamine-hydrolysing)
MVYRSRTDRYAIFSGTLSAWDMEFRDPCGDKRVFEFCYAIPDDQFLRDGQTKWLLRRAMTGVLPDTLLNERARGRQASDWYEKIAQSKELLLAELDELWGNATFARLVDLKRMRTNLESYDPTRAASDPSQLDLILLRCIAMGRFVRRFQDGCA